MLELAIAGGVVAVGALAVNKLHPTRPLQIQLDSRATIGSTVQPDLPCPWCHADTSEDDDHCPTCRQRFG